MPDQATMPDQASQNQGRAVVGARAAEAESGRAAPTFAPPTDIYETKDALILLIDVPGADPASLDVTLEKSRLTISARAVQTPPPKGYTAVYREYRPGNYERSFTLSGEIDADRVDAQLKDGVVRLTLPKVSPSPAKKIEVKAN